MPPVRFLFLVVLWVFAAYTTYIAIRGCNNSKPLGQMIERISTEFAAHNIRWTLDYGSLLGMIRDGRMIAFEFDNDITVYRDDLDRLMQLKEMFHEKYGYHLYAQGDYMFYKALYRLFAFEWDPYIHSACGRLYDERHWLYTDIFCAYEFPADELKQQLEDNVAKPPMTKDTTYTCQGYDADLCACRATQDMFPFKSVPFHALEDGAIVELDSQQHDRREDHARVADHQHQHQHQQHGNQHEQNSNNNQAIQEINGRKVIMVNVPAQPEKVVEHCYGKDWRTPRPKGIKTFLCVWYVQLLIYVLLAYSAAKLYKSYRILTKERIGSVVLPITRGKE